jgi:hypothetical protein
VDYHDLGITVLNTDPQVFFTNVGEERISCSADELLNLNKYRVKCLQRSLSFPDNMARKDWDRIIKNSLENATRVDPPDVVKTDAQELETLENYFSIHIMASVRQYGKEFLEGKCGESVRVIQDDGKIYFKHRQLLTSIARWRTSRDAELIRQFIANKCEEHKKDGLGVRGWFRCTYSIKFNQFDKETLQRWFDPDREEKDE